MKIKNIVALIPITLLFLSACGGGGGSSSELPPVQVDPPSPPVVTDPPPEEVIGLEMPEIISIISESASGTPTKKKNNSIDNLKTFDEPDTDFSNDIVRAYVWDESMGPMQQVNQILCYVGQTRADALVNETYTVLVDTARCETQEEDDSEASGQSSDNNEVEYQLWTIESTRESSESPQQIRIWVPSEDEGSDDPLDQQSILVEVTINSSPSDELPFGDFNMNWQGVSEIDGNEISLMAGTIQTVENQDGKLQFMFYNGADLPSMSVSFSEAANVILDDADGTTGIGKTATHRIDPNHEFHSEYAVAYDPTRFLRGNDINNDSGIDQQSCNDRLNMEENVWRYNLYSETDGSRIELNSGFPFVTTIDNRQINGFMSYWGMWLPGGIDKSQVITITEQDFSDEGTDNVYDVMHAPGRLIKRTKSTIPLAELDGDTFVYFDNGEFLVEYSADTELNDGTAVDSAGFYQIASIEFTENDRQIIAITPTFLDLDFLHFYSDKLRGSVAYDRFSDPTNIVAFKEEFVTGNEGSVFGSTTQVTLACYHDCLKSGLTTAQLAIEGDSPFLPGSDDPTSPAAIYTFSSSDLTLRDEEGIAIAMATGQQAPAQGFFTWGIQTGAMVIEGTPIENGWDTWNQEVSYKWETGPNDWNQMTYVIGQGSDDFVQFDRPMQFLYAHNDANDRNLANGESGEFDGSSFLLEYGGPGDLWGFPELQFDNGRHQRAFSLKDGTGLNNAGGNFVVKATELEKHMRELDIAACTEGTDALSLDIAQDIQLPTADDVSAINFTLAEKPVVTDSPRVVGGELVGE